MGRADPLMPSKSAVATRGFILSNKMLGRVLWVREHLLYMNARTQVSKLEQCSVVMICVINLICWDFNVVADQCTVSLHGTQ